MACIGVGANSRARSRLIRLIPVRAAGVALRTESQILSRREVHLLGLRIAVAGKALARRLARIVRIIRAHSRAAKMSWHGSSWTCAKPALASHAGRLKHPTRIAFSRWSRHRVPLRHSPRIVVSVSHIVLSMLMCLLKYQAEWIRSICLHNKN